MDEEKEKKCFSLNYYGISLILSLLAVLDVTNRLNFTLKIYPLILSSEVSLLKVT